MRIGKVDQYQVMGLTATFWAYNIDIEDLIPEFW